MCTSMFKMQNHSVISFQLHLCGRGQDAASFPRGWRTKWWSSLRDASFPYKIWARRPCHYLSQFFNWDGDNGSFRYKYKLKESSSFSSSGFWVSAMDLCIFLIFNLNHCIWFKLKSLLHFYRTNRASKNSIAWEVCLSYFFLSTFGAERQALANSSHPIIHNYLF